ncbi:MAG TPA: hypothetical protein VE954_09015 [Oligoflexus sp.]|uniref:hypothetical protein n=1 Tax=Oligoflexus sp. TaxID=1971216 RepID=UPI002D2419D3|nr:hypothetical protein [Oligoflexus sp.]HYX33241.1 hypothetical protein [Oligoflexus sp.]
MNLYQIFTQETDTFFAYLKEHNLFYRRIVTGAIQVNEFASFLRNVSFLTTYTPVHLVIAERVAKERGLTQLAQYFKDKRGEEVEHHRWGDADVAALKAHFKVPDDAIGITKEMKDFIQGNEKLIHRDPFSYFVYILFSEYFTVIAGPECLAAVEKHARIPQDMMTIIGRHAELDKHHVKHWIDESVDVGLPAAEVMSYQSALREVMDRYSLFAESISRPYVKAAA